MKRSPMKPGKPMKPKVHHWTAAEKVERAAALDVYRDCDEVVHCADCGRSLWDSEVHLHHNVHRSQGGSNHRSNLVPLCADDHSRRHGITVISPTARNGAVEDGDAPRLAMAEMQGESA